MKASGFRPHAVQSVYTRMSWAAHRRLLYAAAVALFLLVVVGGPIAYKILTIPATCADGKQNQGETAVDKGGPCPILDEKLLSPASVLWARSFRVRDGTYNAIAYVQNSNKDAGALGVRYRFGLYDSANVLIAERTGTTFIMPGGVTPVFEGAIDTGNRIVTHTYFEFVEPITWEKLESGTGIVTIGGRQIADVDSMPRITAQVKNTSVADVRDVVFSAVAFDAAGNAIAASETTIPLISPNETRDIAFTWPDPFSTRVGKLDILAVIPPHGLR